MPERQADPEAKKGVHGWRAFFLMFGCGTTAALLVVGIVVGGLRMLVSSVSSDSSGQAENRGQPAPTWQAPSSLDVGVLDICGKTVESITNINVPNRLEGVDNYMDTGKGDPEIEGRVISDECVWDFNPMASDIESWRFTLEYESFINKDGGSSPSDLAASAYSEKMNEISGIFEEVEKEGAENVSGESRYYYGNSSEGGVGQYVLIGKIKGSVYSIKMESKSDSISKDLFWNEVEPIADSVTLDLERWTPE